MRQDEVLHSHQSAIEQFLPHPIYRERNIDDPIDIRIVKHDDEPFERPVICRSVAMVNDQANIGKDSVTVLVGGGKEVRRAQRWMRRPAAESASGRARTDYAPYCHQNALSSVEA